MQINYNEKEGKWAVLANKRQALKVLTEFAMMPSTEERLSYLKGDELKNAVRLSISHRLIGRMADEQVERDFEDVEEFLSNIHTAAACATLLDQVDSQIESIFDYLEDQQDIKAVTDKEIKIAQILAGDGIQMGGTVGRN